MVSYWPFQALESKPSDYQPIPLETRESLGPIYNLQRGSYSAPGQLSIPAILMLAHFQMELLCHSGI